MKKLLFAFALTIFLLSCKEKEKKPVAFTNELHQQVDVSEDGKYSLHTWVQTEPYQNDYHHGFSDYRYPYDVHIGGTLDSLKTIVKSEYQKAERFKDSCDNYPLLHKRRQDSANAILSIAKPITP